MAKTEEQTDSRKLQIIMSRHGEGLHNVAGKKISAIWKGEVDKIRKHLTDKYGDTPEVNGVLDKLVKEYRNERDDIAYNLLKEVDATKYKDPSLTEKGETQASYSGKALQAYADKEGVEISPIVFASPFARTINSLEQVLQNTKGSEQQRFAIPDLMETSGRYVDLYDVNKDFGEYTVLGDDIDVHEVMKGTETEKEVVARSTKGLEKMFKELDGKETGLPIVVIHGGVMKAFSDEFFDGKFDSIENSVLWNMEVSFDESGKFVGADLLGKIEMSEPLKKEFDEALERLEPSEKLLDTQDFSPIESALSNLAGKLQTAAEKNISENQKANTTLSQEQKVALAPSIAGAGRVSASEARRRMPVAATKIAGSRRVQRGGRG